MTPTYDVVVAGLGGFGSSAACHLARRGRRILGLDPRPAGHVEGASHGESRIVRQVYFEGAAYVPLLQRTYDLWGSLAGGTDAPLLRETGGLFLGAAGTRVLAGSLATAEKWGLEHELLDAAEIAGRFPAMRAPPGVLGLYEPRAGVVEPETAVAAHLRAATAAGAELRHGVAVSGWSATSGGVEVMTSAGRVQAGALVLAPGRWAAELLGGLDLPLRVESRVQHWFSPADGSDFAVGSLPVWMWDLADGNTLYGTPALAVDGSVKAAVHFSGGGKPAGEWTPGEIATALAPLLPGLGDRHVRAAPCWYTLTPDEHFVIGAHPASDRVLLACGFSGHGFKFTPVIGEVLADLAIDGRTPFDLSLFAPTRFAGERAAG